MVVMMTLLAKCRSGNLGGGSVSWIPYGEHRGRNLDNEADDRFYLMAPDHNCKLAFSDWITRPEQRTKENYAAFEGILAGLVTTLEKPG